MIGNGSADIKTFAFGSGNQYLTMNSGATALEWKTLSITNGDVSGSAAIAYSKLNLTGGIVNDDLAGSIANNMVSNSFIVISFCALSSAAPLANPLNNRMQARPVAIAYSFAAIHALP